MYKVVIPTAGLGTRAGPQTKVINKALITVNHKPVIINIMERFNENVEFVILLGYKGDHVRQVIDAFYPDRKITYVEVDKFEGEGSGLGYSLSRAESQLQCPFVFVSNDTLIPFDNIDIDPNIENWIGYYEKQPDDGFNISQYRTIYSVNGKLSSINPKGAMSKNIYIGVCGVKDYKTFWKAVTTEHAVTVGESYGLQVLNDVSVIKMQSWCDTGNIESLTKTKSKFSSNGINILDKEGESIWFHEGKVYKFSVDDDFISDRVKRLEFLDKDLFPKITHFSKNVYVYDMVEGEIISEITHKFDISKMLDIIDKELWSKKTKPTKELLKICHDFYRKKTYDRVNLFLDKFEVVDREEYINGILVPSTATMLASLDWDSICNQPHLSSYHGDFHNENILRTKEGKYVLIDWRQNFGKNNLNIGDAYYDFAKFYHGLIVSHGIVHNNQFSVEVNEKKEVFIDIHRPNSLVETERVFIEWLNNNGYDVSKVKTLTALIYLNVAGLHEYPYSLFLYYLGKHLLNKNENLNR